MCALFANDYFGLPFPEKPATQHFHGAPLFFTSEYALDQIWFDHVVRWCQVAHASSADLFLIPYPATGLFFGLNDGWLKRHAAARYYSDVKRRLLESAHWKRCGGCDHVIMLGHVPSEFRRWRSIFNIDDPFWHNVTKLSFEVTAGIPNLFSVPYPTSLHPTSIVEMAAWVKLVSSRQRRYFSSLLTGPPRHNREDIVAECRRSNDCRHLWLGGRGYGPLGKCKSDCILSTYMNSTFCIQPPGDSATRRGFFDSLIAGCIPIIFSRDMGNYLWYTPLDILLQIALLTHSLTEALTRARLMSQDELEMRRSAIKSLIPRVVYSGCFPGDAFDTGLRGLRFSRADVIRSQALQSTTKTWERRDDRLRQRRQKGGRVRRLDLLPGPPAA